MKKRKILCLLLFVTVLLAFAFAVNSFADAGAMNEGLTIAKQDDSKYDLVSSNASVLSDYAAESYTASKKLDKIPQTVEAWVYIPSSLGNASAGTIIGNYISTTNYGEAHINYEIYTDSNPRIWWCDEFGHGDYSIVFSNTKIAKDTWTHVSFVYNNDSGVASCYINGALSEEKYFYPSLDSGVTDFPFVLAGDNRNVNTNYFKGALKDVAMFSSARTAEEIASDYIGVDYNESSLLCYYDIDSSDNGKNIIDETGNGYDLAYSKTWLSEAEMQQVREGYGADFKSDYSFAVFGDTQMITHYYPNLLGDMYDWVVENREAKNILYSIGLGDITNKNGNIKFTKDSQGNWVSSESGEYDEWDVAYEAISKMNGIIPYSLVRGNHDITNSRDTFNQTFGNLDCFTSQFSGENGGKYTDTGAKDPVTGASVSYANTWHKITVAIDGKEIDYVFLNLDYGASDEVLAWASDVISEDRFKDARVIVSTHCYLYADGTTADMGDPTPPSIMRDFMNNGDDIWEKFVSKHSNIEMVISGHLTSNEIVVTRTNAHFENGEEPFVNVVTEMLINPQAFDYRLRSGVVAMFYFDESENKVAVEYYSPSRDAYFMTYNQFVIDLDGQGEERIVEDWDGTTRTAPEGQGTKDDPYVISSAEHLLWMSKYIIDSDEGTCFAGKYFKQVCDIDLNGKAIQSIGYYFDNFSAMSAFSGNYDGGGYSIRNGTIAPAMTENQPFVTSYGSGLFGVIYGAVIENVVLEDVEVVGRGVCGAIVGRAASAEVVNNEALTSFNIISGCEVKDTVRIVTLRSSGSYTESAGFDNPYKAGRVGSICGMAHATLIEGCTSAASFKINGDFTFGGGIVGTAGLNTVVDSCAFVGSISLVDGTADSDSAYGGIVGAVSPSINTTDIIGKDLGIYGNLDVKGCYVTGTYSYTGEVQPQGVVYDSITGYKSSDNDNDGTYTQSECLTYADENINSAIEAIRAYGEERLWYVGDSEPSFTAENGKMYLSTATGTYYEYQNGSWQSVSNLGITVDSLSTPYGTIPSDYASSTMVVFLDNHDGTYTFKAGYDSYLTMTSSARSFVMKDPKLSIIVYFRTDVTVDGVSNNMNWASGKITFDLGGNTIYQASSVPLLPSTAKFYISNNIVYAINSSYVIKNGNIVLNDSGLFSIGAQTSGGKDYDLAAKENGMKVLNYDFDNVNISFAENASAKSLIGNIADNNIGTSADGCHDMMLNVSFCDSCVIDLSNAASGIMLFGANDPTVANSAISSSNKNYITNTIIRISVGAVDVISENGSFSWYATANNGSAVLFEKGSSGEMISLCVPSDVSISSSDIFRDKDGVEYYLAKTDSSTEAGRAIYTLETLWTPYGNIPLEYASKASYPIVVFEKDSSAEFGYKFLGASATYSSAYKVAYGSVKVANGDKTFVMYFRDSVVQDANYTNTCHYNGTLILDLGGNTLTDGAGYYLFYARMKCFASAPDTLKDLDVIVKDGSIKLNDSGLFWIGGATNYDEFATADEYKTATFTFDNVDITFAEGSTVKSLIGKYEEDKDITAQVSMGLNVNFKENCSIDITNAGSGITLFDACDTQTEGQTSNADRYYTNSIVKIEVGAIDIIAGENSFTLSKVGNNGSYVVFKKGEDGRYATVKASSAPAFAENMGEGAEIVSPMYVSDGVYELTSIVTDVYGKIPSSYAAYPIVVIKDNGDGTYTFKNGKNTIYDACAAAKGLVDNEKDATAIVLFRCDIDSIEVNTNTGHVNGTLIFDLDGNTFRQTGEYGLLAAFAKCYQGTYIDKGTFIIKDGNIVLDNAGLFEQICAFGKSGEYSDCANGSELYKVLDFTFDNVNISLSENATLDNLIGSFADQSLPGVETETQLEYMGLNVTFKENCIIDITNAPDGFVLFNANDPRFSGMISSTSYATSSIVNITVEGCSVIAKNADFTLYEISDNGSDVRFTKTAGGNYMTLSVPKGAAAPEFLANSESFEFIKVSENESTVTYRLIPCEIAELSFVPKMSVTLSSNLDVNVYIPLKGLVKFTLDGENYENLAQMDDLKVEIDGEEYYRICISLESSEAARDIKLLAVVDLGENTARGSFTFSIVKYAQKVIANDNTVEEALVMDILSYIRAAYDYFGSVDEEGISRINELLGDNYDEDNAPSLNGSSDVPSVGLLGATFVLDSTPAVRFYIPEGADAAKYKFSVDGKPLEGRSGSDADGTYIELSVYAYLMGKTFEYEIDGGNGSGSYHISSYYEFAKTQDNEKLVTLVERFARYCESSEIYRLSVVS